MRIPGIDARELGLGLPLKKLPWLLLASVAGMVIYGAFFVTSAAGPGRAGMASRHILWAAIGLVAFFCVYAIDFRVYLRWSWLLYIVTLLAMTAVLFTRPIKGAHSWFDLGFMKVQPSEFAKLAYIMVMAHYLGRTPQEGRARDLAVAIGLTLLTVGLILKQPDLGTAMVFMPVAAMTVFVAGARLWQLGFLAAGGAGGAVVLWQYVMNPIQKLRVYAWLDPEPYKATKAFQMIQSQIAAGSGGLWGKGLGMGTQNHFDLLPLKESDFIFAVIAEEGGFVTTSLLLLMIVFMILAGAMVALKAVDREGQLLAASATALLGGQAIINVAVTLGLLPTTGITLPFVSYGGSSMLASFMAVGLIANVAARPRKRGMFG